MVKCCPDVVITEDRNFLSRLRLFTDLFLTTLSWIALQKTYHPNHEKKTHVHMSARAIVIPMNLNQPGVLPILSANSIFFQPSHVNGFLILGFTCCILKLTTMKASAE